MKKKGTQKVKRSSAKSQKPQPLTRTKGKVLQMNAPRKPQPQLKDDPRFAQAVQNYEAGVKLMQERKFDRAKAMLQKVVEGPSRELADRAAMHLNICSRELGRTSTSFKTPEEHYDYAVSLMNQGNYEESRAHLEKILKQQPKADYAMYGLAILDCLTGKVEDALRHLDEAIRLNPANRFQARNDSDFQNLADDPRFTELLYPEPGGEFSLPPLKG
ncbi:MAG: tetratricopeptide repeat protein [Acidobacteriaceae bacterium]|nr:tetratricopeptide repeat protein [Acidobacteriaceae bacterium]